MMSAKSRKPQKIIILALAVVILCSSIVSLFTPSISNADYKPNSVSSQNDRTILVALETCLTQSVLYPLVSGGAVNQDDMADIISAGGGDVPVGYEIDSTDGTAACSGVSLTRATRVIGKTSHWFFNQIYDLSNPINIAGTDALGYNMRGGFKNINLINKLKSLTPAAAKPPVTGEEKKRRVARAFWICNEEVPAGKTPSRTFNKIGGKTYQYKDGQSGSTEVSVGMDLEQTDGKYTCNTLLHWGDPSWLVQALKDYPAGSASGSGTGAPPGAGGGGSSDSSCQGGALGWVLCPMIDLLSKTTTFAANMVDSLLQFRVLAKEAASGDETIRSAWQGVLSIANIFLVLAFLIIIFSQSTSLGLSNYGIKRMLPRLILAAILINISFYICAFMVDVSNIIGSSIMGFLVGPQGIGAAFQSNMTESSGFAQALVGGVAIVAIIFFFLLPVLLAILLVLLLLIARLVILGVLIVVSPLAFAAWLLPNTENYFKKWWDLFTKLLFIYPVIMAIFGASLMFSKITQDLAPDGNATIANLISLAILAIPLFALPKILMSTNSIMGQVGGLGQKFNKFVEGSKFGQGVKARGRAYGKFGALGAAGAAQFGAKKVGGAIDSRWGGRGVARSRTGYAAHGAVLGAKRVGSAAAAAARGAKKAADFDRAVVEAAEGRKRQKESDRAKRMYGVAASDSLGGRALRAFGGENFASYVASQRKSASDEKVKQIEANMELGGHSIGQIGKALRDALRNGDHETVRAAMNRLSGMGAGGQNALAHVLTAAEADGGAGAGISADMQTTVSNSINDNYNTLVSKVGDIAKGGFDQNGQFSNANAFGKLSAEQMAGQSPQAIMQNIDQVTQGMATEILNNPNLRGKISNQGVLTRSKTIRTGGHVTPTPATHRVEQRLKDEIMS